MIPNIDEISRKLSIKFQDEDILAKSVIQILVCGSYQNSEDLTAIENFRSQQKEKGILGVRLMKDIEIKDNKGNNLDLPLHQKLLLIWKLMKEGDNVPIFILYAGKSAETSLGLNAEIQSIACDKEKLACAYLFKVPNTKLVSHERCFANVKEVKDSREFIIKAEKVVDAYINQIKMFYQARNQEK